MSSTIIIGFHLQILSCSKIVSKERTFFSELKRNRYILDDCNGWNFQGGTLDMSKTHGR